MGGVQSPGFSSLGGPTLSMEGLTKAFSTMSPRGAQGPAQPKPNPYAERFGQDFGLGF